MPGGNHTVRVGKTLLTGLLCAFYFGWPALPTAGAKPPQDRVPKKSLPVLTRVEQIRNLTAEEARQGYPVQLRGVITYNLPEFGVTFFQDSTFGIFLHSVGAPSEARAGDLVEARGVTGAGDFAPVVDRPQIHVLGHTSLPPVHRFHLEDLLTGKEDSQWVEVGGIVQSVGFEKRLPPDMREGPPSLVLGIAAGRNKFKARIGEFQPAANYSYLIDAAVTVRGACGTLFNDKRQLLGIQLFVPNLGQVRIEEGAPSDPYTLPIVPTSSLMRFTAEKASGHRLRVQGVVTLAMPGRQVFVQDSSGGVVVMSSQNTRVQPGDRVEAVGFPTPGQYAPVLEDGEFRRIGRDTLPAPIDLTRATSLSGEQVAELVKIRGRVIDQSIRGEELVLTMQMGGFTFTAFLEKAAANAEARSIPVGSRLQLTGVCSVQTDEYRHPTAFRVLLRSPQDIVVLERPSWWTLERTLAAVGLMAGLILGALAWVVLLRRRVEEQTATIRQRLHEEALLKERYKELFENANDMVFTCSLRGHLTSLNKAGERITGYSRAEVTGMKLADIVAPDHLGLVAKMISHDGSAGEDIYELEILAKQGRRMPLEVSIQTIYWDNEPIGVQGIARDVTQRKRAEEALRETNEYLESLFNYANAPIIVWDPQFRITRFNHAFESLTGRRAQDVIGESLDILFPPGLVESSMDLIGKTPAGDRLENAEISILHLDGSVRSVLWNSATILAPDGKTPLATIAQGHDITKRKRAEEALRTSEERSRIVAASISDLIYEWDLKDKVDWYGDVDSLMGYPAGGFPRTLNGWAAALHPEDKERVWVAVENQLKGVAPYYVEEYRMAEKDGGWRWWSARGTVLRDEQGQPRSWIGAVTDITERKRAEEALRASEERYRTLFRSAVEGILVADAETRKFMYANPAVCRMLGYTEEEMVRLGVNDIHPPEDLERVLAEFTAQARGEKTMASDLPCLRKDGTTIYADVSSAPASIDRKPCSVGFFSDVTERKRAQEELRRAKEAAESASRAKSEFLANMSHEIRTPMNGIIGMTELALDTDLKPEQRECLRMVKASADSLLGLINDILDFSKIEAGKLELDQVEFNLRDSLGDTLKGLALRAHQKGLELAGDVSAEVPEALRGDPTRLRQILVNLVGNAIKFTEHGEVWVKVEREAQAAETLSLRFTVKDTGIGISPENQQKIFDPFTQADGSMTRKYGGTGLGLAISTRLVNAMGGRIWAESRPDAGSAFYFTVVLGLCAKGPESAQRAEVTALEGMPVLVVDDNPTNQRILEEMLTRWRMLPALADGGWSGLAALERALAAQKPFPLILIDAQMPVMDGFELAEHIRRHPRLAGATIMMLTSAGQPGDAARCRALGIVAYLIKPIRQSELFDAILLALGKSVQEVPVPPLITRHSLREGRRKLRVLLAEDNAVNRELVVRWLEKWGYAVVTARNGREVLAVLETQAREAPSFDIILMDVQMPDMDGFEATAAIRSREQETGQHLPIVALTAHAMKGDRERCLAAGMDAYVAKPVEPGELFDALERWSSPPLPGTSPASEEGAARTVRLDAAPSSQSEETVQDADVFDRAEVLARVDGDFQLLAELAGLFLQESPKLLASVQEAVEHRDAQALERAAHALKGSAGNFAARATMEAARQLETMGRASDLTQANQAFLTLQAEMQRLQGSLENLRKKVAA